MVSSQGGRRPLCRTRLRCFTLHLREHCGGAAAPSPSARLWSGGPLAPLCGTPATCNSLRHKLSRTRVRRNLILQRVPGPRVPPTAPPLAYFFQVLPPGKLILVLPSLLLTPRPMRRASRGASEVGPEHPWQTRPPTCSASTPTTMT